MTFGLRIATRLWLAPATTAALVLVLGAALHIVVDRVGEHHRNETEAREQRLVKSVQAEGLARALALQRDALVAAPADARPAGWAPAEADAARRLAAMAPPAEGRAVPEDEAGALARLAATQAAWDQAFAAAQQAAKADDAARQRALQAFAAAQHQHLLARTDHAALAQRHCEEQRAAVYAARGNVMRGSLVVLALFALGLAWSTRSLVRTVIGPLRELAILVRRIGDGDLATPLNCQRSDEIGDVQRALEAMRQALSGTVGEVGEAAAAIQNASAEVTSGSLDLSRRTIQASTSLQETSTSMGQLTEAVGASAGSATEASQLAAGAAEVATRGGAVVNEVVTTMKEINASSHRIADIVGVIDSIAFQTNILALNAAVEAARAGEQGRGFAVVAGEVRSLAQRSAHAAREIKGLIHANVGRVDAGSRLVAEAGRTMDEIVGSVRRVTETIGSIASAAQEQTGGIGRVNDSVGQLDQMTVQNATLVEESAAAAESLKQQSQRLMQLMGRFTLQYPPPPRIEPYDAFATPPPPQPAEGPAPLAPASASTVGAAVLGLAATAGAVAAAAPAPQGSGVELWEEF